MTSQNFCSWIGARKGGIIRTKYWYICLMQQNWHKDVNNRALWSEANIKRLCSDTPCCYQTTLGQAACLAVQPGLQLALLPVAHRRPGQDLLPRRPTLPFTIGHQKRVLFEADGLRVYQAFFFLLSWWINGRWWASTVCEGVPTRGELGSTKIISLVICAGFEVRVGEGLCAMSYTDAERL